MSRWLYAVALVAMLSGCPEKPVDPDPAQPPRPKVVLR
jgi:hypothetical protein